MQIFKHFFENFFQRWAPSERRPGSFSLLRLQRYCYLPNWQNISQEKFKQIFTDFHTQLAPNHLHQKNFSHAKTAPKKQCASRPTTHTLYNIENEFFKKISDSIKLHFFSAKKIRKATFVAYFNFDSFLIHFKFCHIRRFTQLNISIKIKQIFNRQGKDTDKIRETHSFWRNFFNHGTS